MGKENLNKTQEKINDTILQHRLLWADVIRIVATYLVIQVHSSVIVTNSILFLPATFFAKLNVISVPLFVLLSGALLLGKQESYRTFFRKRTMKVLLPWIVWTFIYMIYFLNSSSHQQVIKDYFSNQSQLALLQWGHYFVVTFLSNLWFLPLIFGLYLITPFLRIFVKHAKTLDSLYVIVLWFLFASLLPFLFHNDLFPKYQPSLLLSPFQYIGLFLCGFMLTRWKINLGLPVLFLLGVLPLYISFLPIEQYYIKNFSYGFLDPGTVISSIFFYLFFYKLLSSREKNISLQVKKIIALISGVSLGVYIIHGILLDLLHVGLIKFLQQYNVEFILPLLIFSIAACLVFLLQRIPVLKHLVP